MIKYNDYELLYLCTWHSEEALALIIEKYSTLIHKRLRAFRICKAHYEDFFEDCIVALYDSVKTFDVNKNTSFYTYFDLILERRIMRLLSNNEKYYTNLIFAEVYDIPDSQNLEQTFYYERVLKEIQTIKMSKLKKSIYNEIILENKKISSFVKEHNLDSKDIYNQMHLLRKTIQKYIK